MQQVSAITDLAKDVLQPELKSSEEKAVPFDSGQAEFAEVETGEVECSATDEQVVRLRSVHIAAAVKAPQRYTTQLYVTNVNAICRRRRRTTSTDAQCSFKSLDQ